MPRLFELVDFNGKLAIYWGDRYPKDRPARIDRYQVAQGYRTEMYTDLLGQVPRSAGRVGPPGYVSGPGNSQTYVDLTGAPMTDVETAVPKPRDGKEYTWAWAEWATEGHAGWRKDYFPGCKLCRDVHNPAFPDCPKCGRCHKAGGKCKE